MKREEAGYSLTWSHATIEPGRDMNGSLRIVGRDGFKVNTKYPHSRLEFNGATGVTVKPSFAVAEAAAHNESELRFAVPFKVSAGSGGAAVDVRVKFSVCNDTECLTPVTEFRWEPLAASR